jgi:hypothetical protein
MTIVTIPAVSHAVTRHHDVVSITVHLDINAVLVTVINACEQAFDNLTFLHVFNVILVNKDGVLVEARRITCGR